jgi:hypothetical protein
MFRCKPDQDICRVYLVKRLKALYIRSANISNVTLEGAGVEGSIAELECLWEFIFFEDPPSREMILKTNNQN